MNGFLRTLVIGFAALGVLFLGAGATALFTVPGRLASQGLTPNEKLREIALTPEEQAWLKRMKDPPKEVPSLAIPQLKTDELLTQMAELANAQRANELVQDLRRRTEGLAEREAEVARREAELQLARADLARLQRVFEERQTALDEQSRALERDKAVWAATQVETVRKVNTITAGEKARYQEQARLFEQMKDNAWQSLRRFPPREIARYLAFMEPKKAARMMVLAQQDEAGPGLAVQIHREMMTLDPTAASASQIELLTSFYLLMPPAQVLPFLRESTDQEVADILHQMAQGGNLKQRAALMEALRIEDSRRQLAIQRLVEARTPAP
jgi:hypothetical protein